MQKGCPKCGRLITADLKKCPFCNYDFSNFNMFFKKVEAKTIEEEKYAGFIKRLIAGLIDIYVVLIITALIMIPLGIYDLNDMHKTYINILRNVYIITPLYTLTYILYSALLERSKWHGSLGKKLVGIEVVDEYENPVTLGTAFIRNLVKYLNVFTLGIGFIMSLFSLKKQTLGDKVSKTYVISKINFNEEKAFKFTNPMRRFIAYIIDVTMISIITYSLYFAGIYAKDNISGLSSLITQSIPRSTIIISLVIITFYFPIKESTKGQTLGKKIMKIKLVDKEGELVNFQRAFIRQFLNILDMPCLGFLLVFSNRKKQTLKDKISKTVVIDD